MTKNIQVNFTTVTDYRQTFSLNLDFEAVKKELVEKHDFDDEEAQTLWETGEHLYQLAWEMIMDGPDKYRNQALGEGDYDNEVVYNDSIIRTIK